MKEPRTPKCKEIVNDGNYDSSVVFLHHSWFRTWKIVSLVYVA